MKTNCWLILGLMVATSAIAQNNTNALPEMPAPVTSPAAEVAPAPVAVDTSAPAAKPIKKKKVAAPKKLVEPTVTLVPGTAEIGVSNVNVRGQAGLKGEVIAHLFKGDVVTVFEQINLSKHKADEPAQWAKISYPTNAHVWIRSKYIDTNGMVISKKLNLRAGPGENFSTVGIIERGTPVTQVELKGDWMKIEPPATAYAFVAAMYLQQEAAAPGPITNAVATPETEPMPTPVPETQPIAPEQTNAPAPAEINNPPAVVEPTPAPPRVVTHEGVVDYSISPNAPTDFKLYDPGTSQDIDYLYTTAKDLDLKRYVHMRIVVTGVEGLDSRWQNTPVITIERIQVIDTNAVQDIPIKHKH
ncbi:MAG TPA: SH3 domain-containing protein [Dongiaceae bacterium]|nr:SH3 domain-containing protein [Dongiaceae bacterium]